MPAAALPAFLWPTSRVSAICKSGAADFGEPRSFIDAMRTASCRRCDSVRLRTASNAQVRMRPPDLRTLIAHDLLRQFK